MDETLHDLVLVVTASYAGAIGYGDLYKCHVTKVISGTLSEETITVSILANDKEKVNFMSSHLEPVQIEIGFNMLRKGEPYRMAPVSGFVDRENTSWEIGYMRKIHE
jgi:hypothetical protein